MGSPISTVSPLAFIEPCLPWVALQPPSEEGWLHEVKHPGHRLMACRAGDNLRLFAQHGEDWTERFPALVEAVRLLPVKSCIIDGELVGCDENGNILRDSADEAGAEDNVSYYAFDLIEVNGFDVRRDPIEDRKRGLAHLLRKAPDIMRFNPHFEREGEAVFREACRMGFDGVVSKRRGSPYLSGRCTNWLFSRKLD